MLVATGQPTLLPYLDRSLLLDPLNPPSLSPDVMNEVDMNGRSHAPGYPVNVDAMDVRHHFLPQTLTQSADDLQFHLIFFPFLLHTCCTIR